MKERLQYLLSEVGESFDYLKSDIRNLSRYMAELEDLLERYRSFASNATLTTQSDTETRRKLLKRTQKIIGSPPDAPNTHDSKTETPSAHISSSCSKTMIKYDHVER